MDAPRPGAPRRIGDDEIERRIALTLETQPEGATRWSTRAMAKRAGLSQTMVSRVWRALGLARHRAETFKLSADAASVDKVRDVVGLSMSPPDRALVLCVDESEPANATGSREQASANPGARAHRARAADAARPGRAHHA